MDLLVLWNALPEPLRDPVLVLVLAALGYQTRELRRSRVLHTSCTQHVQRLSVAVARLYSAVRNLRGEADPLPTLEDLMTDRRDH